MFSLQHDVSYEASTSGKGLEKKVRETALMTVQFASTGNNHGGEKKQQKILHAFPILLPSAKALIINANLIKPIRVF